MESPQRRNRFQVHHQSQSQSQCRPRLIFSCDVTRNSKQSLTFIHSWTFRFEGDETLRADQAMSPSWKAFKGCPIGKRSGHSFGVKHSPTMTPMACTSEDKSRSNPRSSPETNFAAPTSENTGFMKWLAGDEGELDRDLKLLGTSRRRLLQGTLVAFIIAVGGNLFGFASFLLSFTSDDFRSSTKLDQIYPVHGLKRYSCPDYEFLIPKYYLEDQAVAYFQQMEKVKPLDYSMKPRSRPSPYSLPGAPAVSPQVAFGPSNKSSAERRRSGIPQENVSVIKSLIVPGFDLRRTIGEPQEAAKYLLSNVIAPPGSDKVTNLIDAYEKFKVSPSGETRNYYVMEFTVEKPEVFIIHNVSVIGYKDTNLFTFTAVVPEEKWVSKKDEIYAMTESFRIF